MQRKYSILGLSSLAALSLSLLAGAATATKDAPAANDVSAAVRSALTSRFPNVQVLDVRPSPVAGLYEVFTGDSVAYSDATGDHLFVGSLVDTRNQRDLTSERLDERNAIDFASLPLDQAIKTVKGNGSRKLAVFSDPDCPFCQQLEHEIASISDVTVYTFLFPIASLHPNAPAKAHAIWCAPDRSKAWTEWMVQKTAPEGASCDNDPVEKIQVLAKKLRINSTPVLYTGAGKRFGGTLPAAQLEKLLNETRTASAPGGTGVGASK